MIVERMCETIRHRNTNLVFFPLQRYQSHQRNVRERQKQEHDQIDRMDANNNNEQQQGENDANAKNQQNGEVADSSPASNGTSQGSPSGGEQDSNRLPTAALLRTSILSFFPSLIPETTAV